VRTAAIAISSTSNSRDEAVLTGATREVLFMMQS
jgi:hypothetical protein